MKTRQHNELGLGNSVAYNLIAMTELTTEYQNLLQLPLRERLWLARWLIDSTLQDAPATNHLANPLLKLAGRYEGGPGDTAERAEEILAAEIDASEGLSVR